MYVITFHIDLVQTSTKKGTIIREPQMSLDDLIEKTKTIQMPQGGK